MMMKFLKDNSTDIILYFKDYYVYLALVQAGI